MSFAAFRELLTFLKYLFFGKSHVRYCGYSSPLQVLHLLRSFHSDESDPCAVRNMVSFCAPFRHSISFFAILISLNQYFVYVGRLLDALFSFIYLSVACRNITKYNQISADVNITTIALLPINCLCFVMSVLLFRTHRRNVILHASRSLLVEPIFPKYLNLQINCQTSKFQIYNWYCVVVPVVMIQAVKQVCVDGRQKIDSILRKQVVGEEGAEHYFTLLKNQWRQSHESRSAHYEASASVETAS
ncbi:unnamed protein product [Angiostrongylus costaricensis]|uniref:Uncharacterized protein n=1 Tax=Angiostrongylus costaricensis TaxID=334426 RepID=A0A3P7HND5_ANGCS|nr:unnamed protein product [Angiostrongylus costaricensis]